MSNPLEASECAHHILMTANTDETTLTAELCSKFTSRDWSSGAPRTSAP